MILEAYYRSTSTENQKNCVVEMVSFQNLWGVGDTSIYIPKIPTLIDIRYMVGPMFCMYLEYGGWGTTPPTDGHSRAAVLSIIKKNKR